MFGVTSQNASYLARNAEETMKLIYALSLGAVLQTSAALAQPLQQSPGIHQQERPIAAPTMYPQVYAPRRVVATPSGAPSELLHQAPVPPGVRRLPSMSSLPGMRERHIARHVRTHGVEFDLPAIVEDGAPQVIDVPGLGSVDIAEDEYPELFAMLTSDDPDQVEAAYERLQKLASAAHQVQSGPPCRNGAQIYNVPAEGGGRREVKILGCSDG
jgi:hypothetical protein